MLKISLFRPEIQMTPLKPWFWPQSQTSYGRMYTRMGSFDFATKLKITPQTLMPGFGPFYRSILLKLIWMICGQTLPWWIIHILQHFWCLCLEIQSVQPVKSSKSHWTKPIVQQTQLISELSFKPLLLESTCTTITLGRPNVYILVSYSSNKKDSNPY